MRYLLLLLALPLMAQTPDYGRTAQAGAVYDFTAATRTMPIKAGLTSATPSTCAANKELYVKTDATPGQQLFLCNSTGNGFNLVGDGGSGTAYTLPIASASVLGGVKIGSGLAMTVDVLSSTVTDTTAPTNSGSTGANVLKTGTNVVARRIVGGANMTVTENTDDITLSSSGGGGSESTTPTNSGGTGASVLKTGTNVIARKLKAGANITITENTDDIDITATGGSGVAGVAGGNPSFSFTSQTSVTLAHNLGTKNVGVACYDGSDNAIQGSWSISGTAPYDITMTFTAAQTGRCVVLGGTGKYGQAISGSNSYTVTGATHGLGSCDIQVQIWDGSTPAKRVEPDSVTCNSTSKDIVVAFATTQAGRLVIQ